jgi:hypothetical protein
LSLYYYGLLLESFLTTFKTNYNVPRQQSSFHSES